MENRLVRSLFRALAACALLAPALAARAGVGVELEQQIRAVATPTAPAAGAAVPRIEVEVGELDPRLKLAPCEQIEPYLPTNARAWGRTRIGLRCLRGPTRWNVSLPVTVKAFAPALVARSALPAGSVLTVNDVAQAEVDLAEDPSAALTRTDLAVGRTLAQPLRAGQSVRMSHLQPRRWFAAGDTVRVVSRGPGFAISGEAQALTPGIEGSAARVKTEAGRILVGTPVGDRQLEVTL